MTPSSSIDSGSELTDQQVQAALQSDIELLDLYVLGGQTQALLTLLARFTPMMTGVIRRVVSHAQDAEDAFQATCLVLMQSANKIRSRRSIAAWLYGVAYRTACRVRAKSRRQATGLDPLELPDENLPDDPIQQIVRQIELSNLDRELQNLPAGYREPLVEHYILGYSARQIAERMELSSSAVEGRLRRGRQMLRERLAERGASLSVCVAGVAWMRDHQQTAATGQELTDNFVNSTAYQAGDKLAEQDPYLFELVEGETKMQVTSLFKSVGFLGTVAAATVSLSVLALAMQGLGTQRSGRPAQAVAGAGVQAVPAQDGGTTTAVVEHSNPPAAVSRRGQEPVGGAPRSFLGRNEAAGEVIKFVKPGTPPPSWLQAGESDQLAIEETRDRLREKTEIQFQNVPVEEMAKILGEQIHMNVLLDKQALENSNFDPEQLVSMRGTMPLNQALKLMLVPLKLSYEVHPNVVKIVPSEIVQPAIRYYDLSHVLPTSAGVPSLIQTAIALIDYDQNTGPEPNISVVGSMMIASCDEESHLQIEKLLAEVSKLSPENLPANEAQAKGGGVIRPETPIGGMGGMGGGGMF